MEKQDVKTNIICDGLILGNEDVTDDAQAELHRQLLEKEMLAKFPALFTTLPPTPK